MRERLPRAGDGVGLPGRGEVRPREIDATRRATRRARSRARSASIVASSNTEPDDRVALVVVARLEPRAAEIALVEQHDALAAARFAQHRARRRVERARAVDDDERDRGRCQRAARARDPDALDRLVARAQSRGVEHAHRDAVDREALLDHVARGARDVATRSHAPPRAGR